MVEVRLHGELAKLFGMVWNLDIATPREAVDAINANRPGFKRKILELAQRGMCFRVRARDHDYGNEDVGMSLGECRRVDIIPMILGASAGVRFVVGAALVAVGFATGNPYALNIGATLMLGSVVEWLTPVPKREEMAKASESWTLSGPTNTVEQGLPVPIIYGEVLTGGYAISGGISVSQVNVAGTLTPLASVGGQVDIAASPFQGDPDANVTMVFQLSVGTVNMEEPFTYAWTHTGFAGAVSVTRSGDTTATLRLTIVSLPVNYNTERSFSGSVTVTVNGRVPEMSGSGEPEATSVSTTQALTAVVTNKTYGGT